MRCSSRCLTLIDLEIKIPSRDIWISIWLAIKEETRVADIPLQNDNDFSFDECEMGNISRITLGDYENSTTWKKGPLGFRWQIQ